MTVHDNPNVAKLVDSMNLWIQCGQCNYECLDFGGTNMPADFEFAEELDKQGWRVEFDMPICPKCRKD